MTAGLRRRLCLVALVLLLAGAVISFAAGNVGGGVLGVAGAALAAWLRGRTTS